MPARVGKNAISNGGFEDGMDIAPWVFRGNKKDSHVFSSGWRPKHAFLQASNSSSAEYTNLYQSFATCPGVLYRVRFDFEVTGRW